MKRSARPFANIAPTVLVAACAASAGAHAALVPAHLEHQPALGAAFTVAALLTLALAGILAARPVNTGAVVFAPLVLSALIGVYALSVTTGLPWLAEEPEPVDAIALATKAVEATGLVFAIQLIPTTGGRSSHTHKEART